MVLVAPGTIYRTYSSHEFPNPEHLRNQSSWKGTPPSAQPHPHTQGYIIPTIQSAKRPLLPYSTLGTRQL